MTRETVEYRWAIDGIEEGVARIEEDGERMLSIPVHLLPSGVGEGQVLTVTRVYTDGTLTFTIRVDVPATAGTLARSKRATEKMKKASKGRDDGGNVAL